MLRCHIYIPLWRRLRPLDSLFHNMVTKYFQNMVTRYLHAIYISSETSVILVLIILIPHCYYVNKYKYMRFFNISVSHYLIFLHYPISRLPVLTGYAYALVIGDTGLNILQATTQHSGRNIACQIYHGRTRP